MNWWFLSSNPSQQVVSLSRELGYSAAITQGRVSRCATAYLEYLRGPEVQTRPYLGTKFLHGID